MAGLGLFLLRGVQHLGLPTSGRLGHPVPAGRQHSPLLLVTEGEEASGIFLEFSKQPQFGKD